MIFLDLEDLLHIAERVLPTVEVRDAGLLQAAAARPEASTLGEDAYPSLHQKAAALLPSVVRSHALVDGTKLLGLATCSRSTASTGAGSPSRTTRRTTWSSVAAGEDDGERHR